jgi:putative membrane protein
MAFIFRWFILTIAVWVATRIVPGVTFDRTADLLFAALVLGVLNALVKPLLRLISLPVILLTLGFFLVVINAGLLWMTSKLVPGFHVAGFWPAVWASLVISLVSFLLGYSRDRRRRPRIVIQRPPRPDAPRRSKGPPPGKGPIIDV